MSKAIYMIQNGLDLKNALAFENRTDAEEAVLALWEESGYRDFCELLKLGRAVEEALALALDRMERIKKEPLYFQLIEIQVF